MSITHNSEKDVQIIIDEVCRVMKKNSIFISSYHSNKNPQLKFGTKSSNNYFDFKKGDFLFSDMVYAPTAKSLKKKLKNFKILDFVENISIDLRNKKKLKSSNFVIVLKKK